MTHYQEEKNQSTEVEPEMTEMTTNYQARKLKQLM